MTWRRSKSTPGVTAEQGNLPAIKRVVLVLWLVGAAAGLRGEKAWQVFLTGPSWTRHFSAYNAHLNNLHLGIGVEACRLQGRWLLGVNGHYMFTDSNDRPSWWIGAAPGYLAGNPKKLWGTLAVVVGGLKKFEYNGNRFSLFALPYAAFGYGRLGLNVAYLPRVAGTTPVLLVQAKLLLFFF